MSLHALCIFFSVKFIPLLFALVGFGALIAIHECGHFLFCKLFGIHTPTFSIGFGPELFSRKIGRTHFRLAAIPLGGYVEIAGLAEVGQGDQEHAQAAGPDSFETKPFWQKFLVLAGGITLNFVFAYLVFMLLFLVGTASKADSVWVSGIVKNMAADKHGLKPGDAIIKVNDIALVDETGNLVSDAHDQLLKVIRSNPNHEVTFVIKRESQQITLPIVIGSRKEGGTDVGMLGAEFQVPIKRLPFFQAIKAGFNETNRWIVVIISSIKRLITQGSLEGAGGPVMIMSMSFNAAQQGVMALLTFLALISINLALINLLPLGALDGGQILFATIEAIIGRKLPFGFRNGINLVSWVLFISLAIFLTYKDISLLFGHKIVGFFKKLVAMVRG